MRISSVATVLSAATILTGCDDALGLGGRQIVVSGQVLMAGDRSPVAGARLVATTNRTGEWNQHQRAVALSTANGRYSFSLDCPSGAQLSIFIGYEAGRSVLGEPGRDDLVIHSAELDGRALDSGLLDQRGVACTTSRRWTLHFLLKAPVREPVAVAGDHRFSGISAGSDAVCGVTPGGTAHCWGNGALGDGRYWPYAQPGSTPVPVSGGHVFSMVSASSDLACGITTNEEAYCWGGYHTNAIGDGSLAGSPRLVPKRVAGDQQFRTIATGRDHACALTRAGEAYCWGVNQQGQLGTGAASPPSPHPVRVVGGLRFEWLGAGDHHTCALTAAGKAYCWGTAAALGAGRTQSSAAPVPVTGGHDFIALSTGSAHTCGITPAGAAHCWGWNSAGQLGNGTTAWESLVPVAVADHLAFASISAGSEHTCAVTVDQRVYCWGKNDVAQFGVLQPSESGTPVAAAGDLRLLTVAAGRGTFTCGLRPDFAAYCWGANTSALGAEP